MELLKEIREYRVESELAATELIERSKNEAEGKVSYKTTYKTKKMKGEVVDFWWVVQITIDYKE